jgi:RNA polymerase sigma-70 factor (ECF subfamily)
MREDARLARFEETVLAHLDAAYNLARWMTRDEFGADEAVQDACVRAFRAFDDARGPDPKAWFLAIVRNTSRDWLRGRRARVVEEAYEDDAHGACSDALSPEAAAMQAERARWVRACVAALPGDYREVIVLRELEGLSYREISAIVDVPIGTVMSRLARARDLLQRRLCDARRRMQS